jgi:hypothetical protein
MRRKAWMVGLGCASIALSSLCGCSWEKFFPSDSPTLPNSEAVDRALRLCSLRESEQPYHLILEISPQAHPASSLRGPQIHALNLRAQVEVFWLNPITYRIEIHSPGFSQIRIVNDRVVEEHNIGDFYPRWLQNFVDAILDPVPQAARLRKVPGNVPIGVRSHACISSPGSPDAPVDLTAQTAMAQICFQDAEPRIASGIEFGRSVWFDNFAPFGSQQIARTLVNDLPGNILVQGQVSLLEPLQKSDYRLITAKEFTSASQKIETTLVSATTAQSLLEATAGQPWRQVDLGPQDTQAAGAPMTIYIRTDRKGRVREAYPDNFDQASLQNSEIARALTLKFKPLLVNGAPRQIEASLILPSRTALPPSLALSPHR